jgi:hypothetical protein
MLFDDLEHTKKELIEHVEKACAALAFLRDCDPDQCLREGPHYDEWVRHMNNLNSARVWLGMASESLHDELNTHNDQVIAAGRGEQWKAIKVKPGRVRRQ